MKTTIAALLMIGIIVLPGCGNNTPEEGAPSISPEISLEPVLLPTIKQPEITREKEGVRFRWPEHEWVLMEDEKGLYALAQDVTYRLDLQPNRQGLNATALPWREEEHSLEAQTINELVPLKEGLLLITENDEGHYGLAHLHEIMEGHLEWLVAGSEELPHYIISPDKSKVVYMNIDKGLLHAYHSVTGRDKPLQGLNSDQFCGNWVRQIRLSPLGGYLHYEAMDCNTGYPIHFTIVGADSGRIIREKIPGAFPRWDYEDQRVLFQVITSDRLSTTPNYQQLGMYSLQTRDIDFFNRTAEGFTLLKHPFFSQDNAFFIYAVYNHKETRLMMHHTIQPRQQSFLLPEAAMVADTDHWAYLDDKILVVPLQMEDTHGLFIHHITTEFTEIIREVDVWSDTDDVLRWFSGNSSEGIFYVNDNRLMQTKEGNHRIVMTLPKDAKLTNVRTWENWTLVTITSNQEEKQLYFISL